MDEQNRWMDRQTDGCIYAGLEGGRETDKDWQMDRQTGRQADWQIDFR